MTVWSKTGQRAHKERAQPSRRRGFLERKKDFKKRATDYHRKQDHIKHLRGKASTKNPDEFYFGMINSFTENGVHMSKKQQQHTADALKRMTSEDLQYLMAKNMAEKNKILRKRANMHQIDAAPQNSHTIFFDSEEDRANFDPAKHFDTTQKYAESASNRPRRAALKQEKADRKAGKLPKVDVKTRQKIDALRAHNYRELDSRIKRHEKIAKLIAQLQTRKNLQGKGRRKKIVIASDDFGEPTTVIYKWKKERRK